MGDETKLFSYLEKILVLQEVSELVAVIPACSDTSYFLYIKYSRDKMYKVKRGIIVHITIIMIKLYKLHN